MGDALSRPGPDRGTAELHTELLLERLSEDLSNRKVAVVWAKSGGQESKSPAGARRRLTEKFSRFLPEYREFHVSVQQQHKHGDSDYQAIMDVVTWLLAEERPYQPNTLQLPVTQPEDSFLAFRGKSGIMSDNVPLLIIGGPSSGKSITVPSFLVVYGKGAVVYSYARR